MSVCPVIIHPHRNRHKHTDTLHFTTLHYTTLHYTTLHYTTLHYTTLHYTLSYTITVPSPPAPAPAPSPPPLTNYIIDLDNGGQALCLEKTKYKTDNKIDSKVMEPADPTVCV